ncbi:MAG: bacteriocin [Breznakia sp.]
MLKQLSKKEMQSTYGGAISWFLVVCAVSGSVAVYKMITSKSGSFSLGPIRASWGR